MSHDPGRFALKNAVRLAIVAPATFAFAFVVLDDPQAATFAVFGAFGLLLFVDFGGPRRTRLQSYVVLSLVGAGLVALGTLASREPALAIASMAVVGFAILFAGVLNGSFAAASTCALLAFVLAVTVPAPTGEIPSRLLGWGLVCVTATSAALLLWPTRPRDRLRGAAAGAARALAALVRTPSDAGTAQAAVDAAVATRQQFLATPYRPSGATGPTAALAHLVDDLDWMTQLARTRTAAPPDAALARERDELEDAIVQVLEAAAAHLAHEPGAAAPDFARLARGREQLAEGFIALAQASADGDEQTLEHQLEETFHLRVLSFGAWQLSADALRTCRLPAPDTDELIEPTAAGVAGAGPVAAATDAAREARDALGATRDLARSYATMRSVWLQNSVRGALGLTLAVAVGEIAELQHAFWAVLGTISVLRSHALATSSTLLRVVGGTFAGVVVGGLLIWAIGDREALLWILFPPAALLAGYAPKAINLFVGQAAFSVCVLVLFNLIDPVGWDIGILRIEDVAIGAGISLLVGLLLWPRGATAVMRRSVAAAYARSADYLAATISGLLDGRDRALLERPAAEAVAASRRLDDAFRQYLAEPAGGHADFARISMLLSGSTRVRRAAHSLRAGSGMLPLLPLAADAPRRRRLERETTELSDWYHRLAEAVAGFGEPPTPRVATPAADTATGARLLEGVGSDGETDRAALATVWTRQHLLMLSHLEQPLAQAVAELDHGGQ